MIHDPLSERILGCAFQVSTVLGIGFGEKVYENALVHEPGAELPACYRIGGLSPHQLRYAEAGNPEACAGEELGERQRQRNGTGEEQ